ncbi:UDP-N-acetylglucosamine 2-epimerase [Colwellia hornerae]|uniref:UDP-N-acetylglucosamine 2-epimerase (Hydrolyzing) n=1 Tax=Colwellia hornerae TaxID=89402 RepID=A0A5C6QJU5_9GAMM|nr:UDP-N-acetylglucosamine 2-epimerase [Colwellia hornerae]TWX54064.1 UDP-N-acetylglucosamine 2-epimerase (hydrolyzing) [Colwellia hornerae]TWX60839.1 UDP-N-acetylglucosamine 2-epimerase (hydrolyzing) [Colwellia hornerae]TWX69169.1 UDP-N-acetylglucosamine 2-epimerase (hydrolyzing) [Colwellia hornerae]
MIKKIGIVTGTRADFGLLYRTIDLLQKDERFETNVFACGTHLSPEYGMTISELESKGISNVIAVEMLLSTSSGVGIAKSVGLATISFADAFSHANLDCLLILGDRYEILAAAQSAMFLNIPIAHIHGGEVTEGAFDDCIRHSLTKMANIHFPVAEQFADRIKQLGEEDNSIHVVGSPGVDNIVNEPRLTLPELEESLGFSLEKRCALVTYHPVTKAKNEGENDITSLVNAIKARSELDYIITYPNADGCGKQIIEQWKEIEHLTNVHIVPSLGFLRYLSVMEHVDCVIGNSSSGIIEAPSYKVGTINIGSRQAGRPRSELILDVDMDEEAIKQAITECCSKEFKERANDIVNPYGEGDTANRIVSTLALLDLASFGFKKFIDRN